MNSIVDKLKDREEKLLKDIGRVADQLGVDSYLIGGYVRDLIMERTTNDIDVVCVGDGIELAKAYAANFNPELKVSVFKNFGTAMLKFKGLEIEFVGARKESYSSDSRKPQVEIGTLEDDQKRRDFTINALGMSINENEFGKLLDPFGGIEDINQKLIRTPLDPVITFSDDPLRMMRAIRFANQLDFTIYPDTLEAIRSQAKRLEIVSIERIMTEFNKIMLCDKPSIGIKLLDETGLLQYFLPEVGNLKGVDEKNGIAHKDNFYHTLQVLDNISKVTDNLWLRWAALLHDIAKPPTKKFIPEEGWTFHGHEILGAQMVYEMFKRLRLPLDHKMKYVQNLVKLHLRPMVLAKEEVSDSAIRRMLFDAGDDIDDLMTLCRADITSKNEKKIKRYLANYDLVVVKLKEIEERDRLRNWQPPISGELIMDTFGIKPSKEVGLIKTAIREAILEGEIRNHFDEAYQMMLKLGKEMGLKPVKEE